MPAQANGVASKYPGLSPDLRTIVGMIAQEMDTPAMAKELNVSVDEAGARVSRLYEALGLDRSLGKGRRALVRETFGAHLAPESEPGYDPQVIAGHIAGLERSERNVLAEWVYAGNSEEKAAAALNMPAVAVADTLSRIVVFADLVDVPVEKLAEALNEGWSVYRAAQLLKRQAAAPAAPASPGVPIDIRSLKLANAIVTKLDNPQTIEAAHLLWGKAESGGTPNSFDAAIAQMRTKGFEPELAIANPAEEGYDVVQLLLIKRKP